MTSKFKSIPKNLYTLNEQSSSKNDDSYLVNIIQSANKPGKNSTSQPYYNQAEDSDYQSQKMNLDEIELYQQQNNSKEEIQKLTNMVQALEQKINSLKVSNKDLKSSFDVSELRNKKHEQRQRQLITKLSHQQVTNQQLEYQLKKSNEEIERLEHYRKIAQTKKSQKVDEMKKFEQQQLLFINSFKKITEAISKCRKTQDFNVCIKKFVEFIQKNLQVYQKALNQQNSAEKQIFSSNQITLDLSFQLSEISAMRSKMNLLEQKYKKALQQKSQQLQIEKNEKKRIISAYNDKLTRLKQQSQQLKSKIDERQQDLEGQIKRLKIILSEKNQIITQLKNKIQNLREQKYQIKQPIIYDKYDKYDKQVQAQNSFVHKKNVSQCSRNSRSKARKRSFYIGDGQQSNTDYMINQLESHIQKLERQLVHELQQ